MQVAKLARIIHTKVYTDTPVIKAWNLLSLREISLLAVVEKDENLVGVIGEDDLLIRVVPDYYESFSEFYPAAPNLDDIEDKFAHQINLKAHDIMQTKMVMIHATEDILKALSKMMVYRVRSLPIVDDNKKYKGMIYEDDIMQYLFKTHKQILKKKTK
jgi:predicted transcriptional regulator